MTITWIAFNSNDPTTWPTANELVLVKRSENGRMMTRSFHYSQEGTGTIVDLYDEGNDYDDGMEEVDGLLWHPLSELAAAAELLKAKGITGERFEALLAALDEIDSGD